MDILEYYYYRIDIWIEEDFIEPDDDGLVEAYWETAWENFNIWDILTSI